MSGTEFTLDDVWVETESDRLRLTRDGLPSEHQRAALDYWVSMRPPGGLPSVETIDPLLIPNAALPWADLVAVEGPPWRFQIRLWGTEVVTAVGRDLKGTWMDEASMSAGIRRLTCVVEQRTPYFGTIPMDWHSEKHRHSTHYTSLGMPFVDEEQTVRRILCFLNFD